MRARKTKINMIWKPVNVKALAGFYVLLIVKKFIEITPLVEWVI